MPSGCYSSFMYSKSGWIGDMATGVLVSMNQTHSDRVVFVDYLDNNFRSRKVNVHQDQLLMTSVEYSHFDGGPKQVSNGLSFLVDADALITNQVDVLLSVKTADCLPIFVMGGDYIAVIHAGRVGTLLMITQQVCSVFKQLNVQCIDVWLGPCSCLFCYEVDHDTHTHFDLVQDNIDQMRNVFPDQHIRMLNVGHQVCTQCYHDLFYSYRMGDSKNRNILYLKKTVKLS